VIASRQARLAETRIYLVVTPSALPADWDTRLEAALRTRLVGMVQLREKRLDDAAFLDVGRRFRTLATRHGAMLIVNDRVHLVEPLEADGAHVGDADLPPELARERLGSGLLLGVSTHDEAEVAAAASRGADHAGLGPCFPSTSKALELPTGGPGLVRRCLPHAGPLPVFPIGGIDAGNLEGLVEAGAHRAAAGAGVLATDDPAGAVRQMHALLGG